MLRAYKWRLGHERKILKIPCVSDPKLDKIKESESDLIATDCPLAAIQLEQGTGEEVIHTIQVLARAYREDGFEKKLSTPVLK